jgi:magnesium chelatase subunit D
MIAADAAAALLLFAADPLGNGLILKGPPCPARDAILSALSANPRHPFRRLPLHCTRERLTGGTDIAASVVAGKPIEAPGLLQGTPAVVALSMAERWDSGRAAAITAAIDRGQIGIIALDEGEADEQLNAALADRCAFRIELASLPDDIEIGLGLCEWDALTTTLAEVEADDAMIIALCGAAASLGVSALRASLLAVRVARVAALCAGRRAVDAEDAGLAARLVLAHRATRLPQAVEEEWPPPAGAPDETPPDQPPPDEAPPDDGLSDESAAEIPQSALNDLILEATRVALPTQLLDLAGTPRRRGQSSGKSGDAGTAMGGGRPVGSRAGAPRDGKRLDLTGSLRAAAPWQRLRGRNAPDQRLRVTTGDLRVLRCKPRTATTTIFAVDASGSQALARLAEAKGAVELLLADCYVRRDSVALVAFRASDAQLLLPPTRAPARARRCLAALAGGGATPLAAGIIAAGALADAAARRGETPTVVLLTDGQANIALSGTPGRAQAQQDAQAAAQALRLRGHRTLLIDTAPRRQKLAETLAETLGARYLPLPRLDAAAVSDAVRVVRG